MLHIDVTFIRLLSSRLQRFKQVDDYVWNCRCPECGDSRTNSRKARGYFFKRGNSILYHCHNCSDKSKPLPKFLKDNFPDLFEEYRKEQLKAKYGENWSEVKEEKQQQRQREQEERERAPKVLPSDPDLGISLTDLSSDHPANEYIRSRKLPSFEAYYTENVSYIARQISSRYQKRRFPYGPRLVIPHRDQNGYLIGVTTRDLTGKEDSLRYIHLQVNKDAFFVYGLETVDFSKPVIVVEGQFDSLFLDNSIAVGGSAMKKVKKMTQEWNLQMDTFILAWDNDPRNRDVCKMVKSAIDQGFNTLIWDRSPFRGKDINEMVLNGHDPKEIQRYIIENSKNSSEIDRIRLRLRFNEWAKRKV